MEEEHAEDAGSAGQIGAIGGATPGVARKMCRREERNELCWRGSQYCLASGFFRLTAPPNRASLVPAAGHHRSGCI